MKGYEKPARTEHTSRQPSLLPRISAVIAVSIGSALFSTAEDSAPPADTPEKQEKQNQLPPKLTINDIQSLLTALGSNDFSTREDSSDKLARFMQSMHVSPASLRLLSRALTDDDAERRLRATSIFEKGVISLAEQYARKIQSQPDGYMVVPMLSLDDSTMPQPYLDRLGIRYTGKGYGSAVAWMFVHEAQAAGVPNVAPEYRAWRVAPELYYRSRLAFDIHQWIRSELFERLMDARVKELQGAIPSMADDEENWRNQQYNTVLYPSMRVKGKR